MLDQKEKVQQLYLDLTNRREWIDEYKASPDQKLAEYGFSPDNARALKKILALFC